MSDHPIQGLMKTAMESIKDMVDVNTIVGDAVETPDGTVILPISRVSFGFAAGGGNSEPEEVGQSQTTCAFGGGSGAGVSVKPVGFLVCSPVHGVRFMPVEGNAIYDRIIDLVPKVLNTIQEMLDSTKKNKEDELDDLAKTAETQSI